jgi:glycosyltransferase involved in cell wall biosynthesis
MPFYPLWENVALPIAAWKDRIDILHCLGNTAPLFVLPAIRLVITLHDVMYLQSGKCIPAPMTIYQKFGRIYRSFVVPRCSFAAAALVTISEFSKQDILCLMPGIRASKISVCYESCDGIFSEKIDRLVSDSPILPSPLPFIFCLGAEDPRKNTLRLVRAYLQLLNEYGIRENLVISGYKNWEGSESHLAVVDAGVEDRIRFLNFVGIDELARLYRTATVFAYPSLYEGFGIPILEAFSSGCPVIASNVTSIPEVGGNAALYFDPLNESEIAQTLLQVLNDANLRNSLKELGYARASQFSWKNTAQQTLAVYKKCMEA